MEDFLNNVDNEVEVTITSSSTQVVQFDLDNSDDASDYLLNIESVDNYDKCLLVGINSAGCPWKDTTSSVTSSKRWSRMLRTGYFPVRADEFGSSIVVSLIGLDDSSECYTKNENIAAEPNEKTVKLTLMKINNNYASPVAWSIISIILCCFIFLVMWVVSWRWQQQNNDNLAQNRQNIIQTPMINTQISNELRTVSNTKQSPRNMIR